MLALACLLSLSLLGLQVAAKADGPGLKPPKPVKVPDATPEPCEEPLPCPICLGELS